MKHILFAEKHIHLTKSIDIDYLKVFLFICQNSARLHSTQKTRNALFMVLSLKVQNRNDADHMLDMFERIQNDCIRVFLLELTANQRLCDFEFPNDQMD